jgi:hypothetical protein
MKQLSLPLTNKPRELVVICCKIDNRLRVRVLTDGFSETVNCRFPKKLRQEGARYGVRRVKLVSPKKGDAYYAVMGPIRPLEG